VVSVASIVLLASGQLFNRLRAEEKPVVDDSIWGQVKSTGAFS
jgi:hypothetical protein